MSECECSRPSAAGPITILGTACRKLPRPDMQGYFTQAPDCHKQSVCFKPAAVPVCILLLLGNPGLPQAGIEMGFRLFEVGRDVRNSARFEFGN